MSDELSGIRVAFLTANEGVEQVELMSPWGAVEGAGGKPIHVALESGEVQAYHHLEKADIFEAAIAVRDADPAEFDALVLPGGVANPDQLRIDPGAVAFAGSFFDGSKPVAVICHGPWILVEADVARGRTLTSWPSLRTDIENAGGVWVDEEVVVCEDGPNVLISSRRSEDLHAFERNLVAVLRDLVTA